MKENKRKCLKCGSSPAEDPSIALYRFPKPGKTNIRRCELWAKYCFPDASWSSHDFHTKLYSEHRMLCHKHFATTSFYDFNIKRLNKFAAPVEQCDTDSVQEPNPSHATEAIAGPSQMSQPCMNISNTPRRVIIDIPQNINKVSVPSVNIAPAENPSQAMKPIAGPSQMSQPCMNISGTPRRVIIDIPQNINKVLVPFVNIAPAENLSQAMEPIAGPSRMSQPFIDITPQNIDEVSDPTANVVPAERSLATNKRNKLSDKENYLYKKCRKHLKNICQLRNRIKKLKNQSILKILSNDKSIHEIIKCKVTSSFALLLQQQLHNSKRKSKGRRWNTEGKIIALRLYKRSPTCYRLLRRLFCLPAPSTLKNLLCKFSLGVGINEQIFKVLKKYVSLQHSSDNEFTLMFDEMSIKKNLFYNKRTDMIEGFQDHGSQGRSPQIASHALVFMVAGIRKKVKQPIAYYYSGGSVTADRLAVIIKEVLQHCFDAGLNIATTVCDLDGVNKRALGILGASVEHPYFEIQGREVVALFDTPHLLKCFRNLFINYDLKCPTDITSGDKSGIGVAKWSFIKQFYDIDSSNPNFVFAPCLKQEHLTPNTKQKMKVKLAAQVLSHSVAAGMYAKISQGELSAEATTTANVLSNMDKLFDCVNAHTPDLKSGKPFATNLTDKRSYIIEHMNYMKKFFKNIEYIGIRRSPPSQEGWIWTLNGIQRLWGNLKNKHKNIKSLATRRLQQDPLENLFGCIRGNCGANTNPTVGQFAAGLKTAILSNLSHFGVGNCENDENSVIVDNYKTLFTQATDIHIDDGKSLITDLEINIDNTFEASLDEGSGELQACAYVCGFIIKNYQVSCELCKKMLMTDEHQLQHTFINFKEYSEIKNSLKYASKNFILCVESCATYINIFLKTTESHTVISIRGNIIKFIQKSVNFDFLNDCSNHKDVNLSYIINSVFYICIKRFCTLKNRQFAEEASRSALKKKINILKHK